MVAGFRTRASFRKGRRRVGKRGDGDAEGHLSAVSFHFLSVGRTCRYEELISRIEVQFMLVEMRALALFRLRTGHRLYTYTYNTVSPSVHLRIRRLGLQQPNALATRRSVRRTLFGHARAALFVG